MRRYHHRIYRKKKKAWVLPAVCAAVAVIAVLAVLCLTGVIPLFAAAQPAAQPVTEPAAEEPQQTAPEQAAEPAAEAPEKPAKAPEPTPPPPPEPTPAPLDTAMTWPASLQGEAGNTLYEVQVTADTKNHTLDCRMNITFRNYLRDGLESLYLHLYPNAFNDLPNGMESATRAVYPNGFDPGFLTLHDVALNGERVNYTTENQGTLLRVPLTEPLSGGGSCELYLAFTVRVPNMNNRFGWNENAMYLGNCLPILAAYDETTGWKLDPYIHIGDPFCSDIADYRVAVTTPKSVQLACSGKIAQQEEGESTVTRYVQANAVREFGWVLLTGKWRTAAGEMGGIQINAYADKGTTAKHYVDTSAAALSLLGEKIAPYEDDTLTVVQCDLGGALGMEYPGLILINDGMNTQDLDMTICHEVAHQWFYNRVGSDGCNEPWVDEAPVQFLGIWCLKSLHGEAVFQKQLANRSDIKAAEGHNLKESLYQIADSSLYGQLVYVRGCYLFRMLYEQMGEEMFFTALQTYYQQHNNTIATGDDLQDAFGAILGPNTALNIFRAVCAGPQENFG